MGVKVQRATAEAWQSGFPRPPGTEAPPSFPPADHPGTAALKETARPGASQERHRAEPCTWKTSPWDYDSMPAFERTLKLRRIGALKINLIFLANKSNKIWLCLMCTVFKPKAISLSE